MHCNANISFNKIYLRRKLVPKYAQIKMPINNEAARKALTQTQTIRIKNKIKFLYKKQ